MRYFGYTVTCLLAVVALGLIAGRVWMLSPYPTERASIERALLPDNHIAVSQQPYLIFRASAGETSRGVIFYPGGRTTADTYVPVLRKLAQAGLPGVAMPIPWKYWI